MVMHRGRGRNPLAGFCRAPLTPRSPIRHSPFAIRYSRPAFSLIELMIAIVILGLGLLVVATMFPIAWTKARDLAESTAAATCTDTAEATVHLLTHVSKDLDGNGTFDAGTDRPSSFLGDIGTDGLDPWVHALHMENIEVAGAWGSGPPLRGDFLDVAANGPIDPYLSSGPYPTAPPGIQVAFQDRVYPPLPVPPDALSTTAQTRHWQELLRQRRFSWSALHKLNYDPFDPLSVPGVGDTRTLTLYVVTLRRGQDTHRYARQDPANSPAYVNPYVTTPPTSVAPQATAAGEDVLFPVPWRVQIEIVPPPPTPTGVPSEALANSPSYSTNRLVPEMMPRGAYLIDELSGDIYRVAKREFDPSNPARAQLTFEREISADSLDTNSSGVLEPVELLRTVWVFPPAVEAQPRTGGLPLFIGPQPVAGIELRTMVISP